MLKDILLRINNLIKTSEDTSTLSSSETWAKEVLADDLITVNSNLNEGGLPELSVRGIGHNNYLISSTTKQNEFDESIMQELHNIDELSNGLDPIGDKNNRCSYTPSMLRDNVGFQDHYTVITNRKGHIRGDNIRDIHHIAGKTVRGGYIIADISYPNTSRKLRRLGQPEGIIIVGKKAEEALQIAEVVYGGNLKQDEDW